MQILILGLALWWVSHLFKRIAPGLRARLGVMPGKMVVTVLSLASIILMVIGYRRAEIVPVYEPVAGMGHLNNLLMLVSIYLAGVMHSKGVLKAKLRHPLLTATILWSVAHLLVNGDLASLVLFGGIGLWAVVSMLMINARESWTPPVAGPVRSDLIGVAIAIVVYAVIAGIHIWLGYNPFLGTYG